MKLACIGRRSRKRRHPERSEGSLFAFTWQHVMRSRLLLSPHAVRRRDPEKTAKDLPSPTACRRRNYLRPPDVSNRTKMFAVLEEYKGELGICIKVGTLLQGVFLDDPRFFRTPYIGKHGWVTLRVYALPLDWKEISELVKGSYQLVAPEKSRKKPKKRSKS